MSFYKKILMTLIVFAFSSYLQSAHAGEAGSSKPYVKGGVSIRSVEVNPKDAKNNKTSVNPLAVIVKAGYSFNLIENQTIGLGLSYLTVGKSEVETKTPGATPPTSKDKDYQRSEVSLYANYRGTYGISDAIHLHYGAYAVAWKFKIGDNTENSVVYSSILNRSHHQTATVQLSPYVGIGVKAGEAGKITAKVAVNTYMFQDSEIDLTKDDKTAKTKERPVEIKGGHSIKVKVKYTHDLGPVKATALTKYNQTIVARSATLKEKPNTGSTIEGKSYDKISGMTLTLGTKVAYNVNENLAIKAFAYYDVLGNLTYETKANKEATAVKYEGSDQSIILGGGLSYMF